MAIVTTGSTDDYPARLSVDYPEGPRNRLTVAFRLILMIPIVILLSLLSGGGSGSVPNREEFRGAPGMVGSVSRIDADRLYVAPATSPAKDEQRGGSGGGLGAAAGGMVILPTMLMLLFRRKYPRWWFDWNLELQRFSSRVGAYVMLLRDEYPSTDEEQAVHLEIDYPDAQQLNRWLPLAAAGEVAARDPALHRAAVLGDCGGRRHAGRVGGHPGDGAVSARAV